MNESKEKKRLTETQRAIIRWTVYWFVVLIIYLALSLIFGNFAVYWLLPALAAVNFVVRILFNLPFRFKNPKARLITRICMSVLSLTLTAILCVYIVSNGTDYNNRYIASLDYSGLSPRSSFTYDRETGVYTVKAESDELRILQLTDVHLCAGITTIGTDRKALDACYAVIKEARPDLIIVTGDIVYPIPIQTFNTNNLKPVYQFCTFMNNFGIPWAMVYGNHDTETFADYGAQELSGIFRYFKDDPACPMLYAEKQPDIYGRYNQYLRIENADGTLNRLIFLIDSNDYVGGSAEINDYDSVHTDQLAWYVKTIDEVSAEEGRRVPSFVYMHIPFKEFAEACDALARGEDSAEYLLGENGENVSHPAKDSGFFKLILEKKSTQAVFVGHDHLNNLGVKYRGVDLVYGKSIDYIAYPKIAKQTVQRGGTLVTLSSNGYEITHIDYNV